MLVWHEPKECRSARVYKLVNKEKRKAETLVKKFKVKVSYSRKKEMKKKSE